MNNDPRMMAYRTKKNNEISVVDESSTRREEPAKSMFKNEDT